MCLIDPKRVPKKNRPKGLKYVYKVLSHPNLTYHSPIMPGPPIIIGKWNRARKHDGYEYIKINSKTILSYHDLCMCGFHCFLNLEDAENYKFGSNLTMNPKNAVIVKCEWQVPIATGKTAVGDELLDTITVGRIKPVEIIGSEKDETKKEEIKGKDQRILI